MTKISAVGKMACSVADHLQMHGANPLSEFLEEGAHKHWDSKDKVEEWTNLTARKMKNINKGNHMQDIRNMLGNSKSV